MKVLVTGGCGFLGSHVCEFYVNRGDSVFSYDNMTKYELNRTGYGSEKSRRYNWDLLSHWGVEMVLGDVRNAGQLLETAKGCDFIIHTAAQPAMTISIESPELDFSTNVLGTFNVLKTARELKIPVVSCSSIHVYGNGINGTLAEGETRYLRNPTAIDENHPLLEGTVTPLHASKRSAEIYVQTFIDTYQLEAANFRFTGLYGPRQFGGEDHGWVANFSIRAALDWPITLFGTGKQVRDILFARDAVAAFHAFYENPQPGTYNIGGGEKCMISLQESLDVIGEILGHKPSIRLAEKRLGDLWYFVCDSSKAKNMLGWEPKVTPREGIAELIQWIQENPDCFQA
ncbi:MAG TPA: NAD-dependent epimerase/dehydratase family protein [Anaerolineales bacterium]|nr:NAD-dependent epimerase/dehydratase family protein [Anaerolineales bacterium]